MKHLTEEQLILYEYDEPADRTAVEAHLAACERCRAAKGVLESALKTLDRFMMPDRQEDYGAQVWRRLAPCLDEIAPRQATAGALRLHWPRWALVAAAGVLAALAFLAGRFWPVQTRPAPQAISEQARNRVLMAAVADHFEHAEILLTMLKHAGREGDGGKIDFSFERQLAEDLLAGNALYEESAVHAGQAGLASVLDELGRALLTVANGPRTLSPAQLSEVRDQIQHEGLLFKVQVLESRLRESVEARNAAGEITD